MTREDLLRRIPDRLDEYQRWLERHGMSMDPPGAGIEIVEHAKGDEILFTPDREAATAAEIDHTIRLLGMSRTDLLESLEGIRDDALDWDPPYREFAKWADWRTIRANLAHVAGSETHYYLRNVGYESPCDPPVPCEDWRGMLERTRTEAVRTLESLKSSEDRMRVSRFDPGLGLGMEDWSLRKALRRMVRHELMHAKSIRRILAEYTRQRESP